MNDEKFLLFVAMFTAVIVWQLAMYTITTLDSAWISTNVTRT